ncbi:hypothetical protein GALMADRAFT_765162 [Galerina marginata CBS 339.88]|uniref:Uncharacterized protein n=1 Tax=Galerina marginata (strain CBS 339.88) TaxID=685588 RepID=A0A067SB89_GALM3|nr:hypothetical protein GALMADRAFT_765162 [Galerina marginata CBS 339.88]
MWARNLRISISTGENTPGMSQNDPRCAANLHFITSQHSQVRRHPLIPAFAAMSQQGHLWCGRKNPSCQPLRIRATAPSSSTAFTASATSNKINADEAAQSPGPPPRHATDAAPPPTWTWLTQPRICLLNRSEFG